MAEGSMRSGRMLFYDFVAMSQGRGTLEQTLLDEYSSGNLTEGSDGSAMP